MAGPGDVRTVSTALHSCFQLHIPPFPLQPQLKTISHLLHVPFQCSQLMEPGSKPLTEALQQEQGEGFSGLMGAG